MYILMTELFFFFFFGFGSETEHILKSLWYFFFDTYTHALFYLTIFWCNELSWFIPCVYHNGRTHPFSFEFGSGTEHMLQNLWYVFLNIYTSTVFFNNILVQ